MNLSGEYRNRTLEFFTSPMKGLLKRYDQVLFENADKAGSNQVQNFESMREFRSKSVEVEKRFIHFLESGIDHFFEASDAINSGFCHSSNELSLTDKDELEDELAINVISLKASNAYAEQLWNLNKRLAVLRGGKKVDDQCNPCGPTHLCQSLRFAVQILAIETRNKILLYQLFEEDVLAQAGDFYNTINADLISHRILPNLRFQKSVLIKKPVNINSVALSAEGQLSGIEQFWFGQKEEAQQQEKKLLEQLSRFARGSERNKIAQEDVKIVEIVGMLFNYILDDPNLPGSVKALISHLHAPMLKVVLIDKGFFNKTGHPALHLLNIICEIGARWLNENIEDRVIYAKLKAIVARILCEFVDDVSIFEELYEDVSKFAQSLQDRTELIEKHQAEAQNGLEKLALAHQCADKEVSSRFKNTQVSGRVVVLFKEPWKDFLALVYLRHGVDTAIWRSSVKVIDGVIWTVTPDRIALKPAQFESVKSKMNASLKRGLKLIGYDAHKSKRLLDDLVHVQLMAFEKAKLRQASAESESSEDAGEVTGEDAEVIEIEQDEQSHEDQSQEDSLVEQDVTANDDQSTEQETGASAVGDSADQVNDKVNKMSAIAWQSKRQQAKELEEGNAESEGKDIDIPSMTVSMTPNILAKQQGGKQYVPANKPTTERRSAISQQLERQQFANELGEERSAEEIDLVVESIIVDLHKLEFGTWFEFQRDHGMQPQVLKLAWYSKATGRFMFVNNNGVKAQVKTHAELSQAMDDGSIKRVEQAGKSFMERALESIVDKLRLAT